MEEVLLSELPLKTPSTIIEVNLPNNDKCKLFQMGLTVGTEITVVNKGIFGDPILINLRGSKFAIRKKCCSKIKVKIKNK